MLSYGRRIQDFSIQSSLMNIMLQRIQTSQQPTKVIPRASAATIYNTRYPMGLYKSHLFRMILNQIITLNLVNIFFLPNHPLKYKKRIKITN